MKVKRIGLAVWVKNRRSARQLKRFGNIHYISKRMNYVSMYVNADEIEQKIRQIQKLHFVTKVERSYRHEIPTEYANSLPDKAKEYDYRMN